MLNKIIVAALFLSLDCPSWADTIEINPENPGEYIVQKGDTLWGIAGRFLTEPWRWPEIWQDNPQIEDPHLIYPGDVIRLSFDADGLPMLTVDRDGVEEVEMAPESREVKLSPAIRSYDRADAIPAIPIDAIQHFLSRPQIVADGEMATWPYVLSSYEEHLIAATGNKIYIGDLPEGAAGKRYAIYRQGPAYKTKSGQVLGYEALYVAEALIERDGGPATAVIIRADREVLNGDRLALPTKEGVNTDFIPRRPPRPVQGHIISVVDGLSQIGQYQVVVLDIGQANGLEVGNVLGVYQSGGVVRDNIGGGRGNQSGSGLVQSLGEEVNLPTEYVGVLMVFRTFGKVSYALVMEANVPLRLYDEVGAL